MSQLVKYDKATINLDHVAYIEKVFNDGIQFTFPSGFSKTFHYNSEQHRDNDFIAIDQLMAKIDAKLR